MDPEFKAFLYKRGLGGTNTHELLKEFLIQNGLLKPTTILDKVRNIQKKQRKTYTNLYKWRK